MAKLRYSIIRGDGIGSVATDNAATELTTRSIGVIWDTTKVDRFNQLSFLIELCIEYMAQNPVFGTTEQRRVSIDVGQTLSEAAYSDAYDGVTYTALAKGAGIDFKVASFDNIRDIIDHTRLIMAALGQLPFQPE